MQPIIGRGRRVQIQVRKSIRLIVDVSSMSDKVHVFKLFEYAQYIFLVSEVLGVDAD